MNELLKESLVEQFRAHLDTLDDDTELEMMADADACDADVDTGTDLHSLYIEMAALRSEVRTEFRLVKDTLDLVRGVVERAETERARVAELEHEAALLKPLLIDLIEVRDRLAAGVTGPSPAAAAAPWYRRCCWRGRHDRRRLEGRAADDVEPVRPGAARARRRPDGSRRQTVRPKLARAVGTVADAGLENGIVVQEVRSGFLWEGELLRAADVVVNKTSQ